MYVLVDLEDEVIELVEPDDLDRLELEVAGGFDEHAVARLLGGLGRLETVESAFISLSALRSMAVTSAAREGWQERFDDLVAEARARGALDRSGSAIRVEVTWPPDTVA